MSHGAQHPQRDSEGNIYTKRKLKDGRSNRRKDRHYEYYSRLNEEWFTKLESLLDIPINQAAGTAIKGCTSRADLLQTGFALYLQVNALARELNYRSVEELLVHMSESLRFLRREGPTPAWLSIEQPALALPPPRPEPPTT